MASRLQRLRREPVAQTFAYAGPAFRRAAAWLLGIVAVVSLLARAHPTLRYAVWGSDSGEYLFLTRQLVETGRVLFPYDGWGLAYPYFPGMFAVSGVAHAVMGVELEQAVQWTVPFLGALIPVMVGLFAYRVTSDPRAGVLAGLFAAVTAPVVITTSHAMPGTLGTLYLVAILALLPDAYRDRRLLVVLGILAAALVVTHHLSTYFAVGVVAFSAFLRETFHRRTDRRRLRVDVLLAALLLGLALVWWLGVAAPFRERIVGDALDLDPWLTAAGFLLALAALPLAVVAKRRLTPWVPVPRYPPFPWQAAAIAGTFVGVAGLVLLFVLTRVPGTNIRIGWPSLWYTLPVLGFLAFLPVGTSLARFYRHGTLALGWLYAILASLAFAVATDNKVLFPFRHVDYMVLAMAPLAALGMLVVYDQTLAGRMPMDRPTARGWMVAGLSVLVLASAVLSLPPRETIGGFEEGMTEAELAAVRWVAGNPDIPPGTTMAADHRISSLLWGYGGIHATWDEAYATYHGERAEEAVEELRSLRVPAGGERRIDYVFLSPPIVAGVTLVQWENSMPMSPGAVAKFEDARYFEKVYDRDDVRIYRVRWDALDAPPAGEDPSQNP